MLRAKTPKSLWTEDLNAFMEALDVRFLSTSEIKSQNSYRYTDTMYTHVHMYVDVTNCPALPPSLSPSALNRRRRSRKLLGLRSV